MNATDPNATDPIESATPRGSDDNPAEDAAAPAPVSIPAEAALVYTSRRDLMARPRDEKGVATAVRPVSEPVLMDPKPLAETPLAPTVAGIRARRPDLAHALEDEHDRRVVHAIREIDRVRDEEDRLLPERVGRAEAQNRAVDEAQDGIRAELAAARGPLQERLEGREEELAQAHGVAAKDFSAAKGTYDSRAPSEAGLPFPRELPEDVVAAELRLPWPLAEHVFRLPAWLHWTLTALVGLIVGVNLALATHVLEADSLFRHPIEVLISWAAGAGLVELAWRALLAVWYNVGHRLHLEEPRRRFWAALLVAAAVTGAMMGADVETIQHGLLVHAASQAELANLAYRGNAAAAFVVTDAAALWFVSLIITLGYLTFAASQGFAEGQNASVRNRIRHYQKFDLLQKEAAFREQPAVRAARAALSDVILRQGRRDGVQERIAEVSRPFSERLSCWEAQRLPGEAELLLRKAQRIQDARQDALKAQADFYDQLHRVMEACRLPTAERHDGIVGRQH